MKILIAYYSKSGKTKKAAIDLSKKINADIDEIIDLKNRKGIINFIKAGFEALKEKETEIKYNKNVSDFDLVIVGTPVWAKNITPAIRTYLKNNKDKFKNIKIFATSGGTDINIIENLASIAINKEINGLESFDMEDFKDEEKYQNKLKIVLNKIV